MTQSLELENKHKVLENWYGAAVTNVQFYLFLVRRVYTIERIKSLLVKAETNFKQLKLTNIVTKHADGNLGWKEQIPFDRIIFTAAVKEISNNFFRSY